MGRMVMAREGPLHSEPDLSNLLLFYLLFIFVPLLFIFYLFIFVGFLALRRTCDQGKKV
jgi:hypothetical protein